MSRWWAKEWMSKVGVGGKSGCREVWGGKSAHRAGRVSMDVEVGGREGRGCRGAGGESVDVGGWGGGVDVGGGRWLHGYRSDGG